MLQDLLANTSTISVLLYNETQPIGSIPIIYTKCLNIDRANSHFQKESIITLLPSYNSTLANFFIYLLTNMYFGLELTTQQLVWVYKIDDEYGLPKEIMQQIHNMIHSYTNSSIIDIKDNNKINIKGNAFDTLCEIVNLCNTMKMSYTPNIVLLEDMIKKIITENMNIHNITLDSITHQKTRKFICKMLKNCWFINDMMDEYNFLKMLIEILTSFNTIKTLTKICIDDILACIYWQNISQDNLNETLLQLTLLPNFSMNNRITKGVNTRAKLVLQCDPSTISFYHNNTTKFPTRCIHDYCKKIDVNATRTYIVYTTTINPKIIKFNITLSKHENIPNGINITYLDGIPLNILVTINYNSENGNVKIVKKWQYGMFSNNLYIKDINNIDDNIVVTFNKVYYV